jgi:hypothetical protein
MTRQQIVAERLKGEEGFSSNEKEVFFGTAPFLEVVPNYAVFAHPAIDSCYPF